MKRVIIVSRIMDYVTWRGDLSFNQVPFNAIDAAIFSQLSIFDFDDIVPTDGEGRTIQEVFELYLGKGYVLSDPVTFLMSNKQHYLFEAIAKPFVPFALILFCIVVELDSHLP